MTGEFQQILVLVLPLGKYVDFVDDRPLKQFLDRLLLPPELLFDMGILSAVGGVVGDDAVTVRRRFLLVVVFALVLL